MRTLTVSFKEKTPADYPIIIDSGGLERFSSHIDLSSYSKILIVSDENVGPHWIPELEKGLGRGALHTIIPSGELHKNVATLEKLWRHCSTHGLDRSSLIINLGGGVITDLGGFSASTYMRGISFIQIPTTLLSQVDASIGGKTGIDFGGIKNLVGSFAQPRAVLIDTSTLDTLPLREKSSGFGEIIKHGLIADKTYFEKVAVKSLSEWDAFSLSEIIEGSCQIKRDIVAQDPEERGIRKLLNFGHTLGHAIESLLLESDHPFLHGEAIAVGMIGESRIANLLGLLSNDELVRIETVLAAYRLPLRIPDSLATNAIESRMNLDKKISHGTLKWTLIKGIGTGIINCEVPHDTVRQAITYLKGNA